MAAPGVGERTVTRQNDGTPRGWTRRRAARQAPQSAPEVVGALFAARPGQVVGPIQVPNGWYFARLDNLTPAPLAGYVTQKPQLLNQVLDRRQRLFLSSYLGALRRKAKIQDLRVADTTKRNAMRRDETASPAAVALVLSRQIVGRGWVFLVLFRRIKRVDDPPQVAGGVRQEQ